MGLGKKEGHPTKEPGGREADSLDQPPRYYIEVLGKALDVLDVLRASRTELRLTDIAEKAGLPVTMAFRLLHTLESRGYVLREKKGKRFKLVPLTRTYRIGYAQLASDQPFVQKVTQGMISAAEESRVELLVADNGNCPEQAVKNAAWLIAQKVDFIIEYQFHSRVGPVLANMFRKAGIPTLAIDIAMPGAASFGADNYTAGIMGGEALARFARDRWGGRVDHILVLESTEAGPPTQMRGIGSLDGIRSVLPELNGKRILHRNANGTEVGGYVATRRIIRSLGPQEYLLIAAANDNSARGAIRAVREAGREAFTAIMAQGWGPDEALDAELRQADSPLIGAVAYFPERYGTRVLPLVLQFLNGQPVPPASYAHHQLIMRDR
jgi:ribose transport system substrate-binding protein